MLNSKITFIILIIIVGLLFAKNLEKFTISRPSKCFSCEREIIRNESIWNVWKALPSKCFDCENNALHNNINPYYTGPTKCFDCDCNYFNNQTEKPN
ncbi:hypothetical protein crov085 [Cafeteria roenbergensis virus]|uniref:Uncharacterized protein n=1 Tax=Cafeteria roenbergensis virus (strain BV-PW1) TaxID=693272 RepID=E3T4K5_CROVB|nr:hypothetical protein crov085 [Cafeteria roenbergensis virus BV-PW1]ADO67118.1 hypothetical protein crov085 [Cafeteria roenbergensis virus BV-PW1]